MTPLHCATLKENKEICRLLIEKKADISVKDRNGQTALNKAILKKNLEIILLLGSVGNLDKQLDKIRR